MVTSTQYASFKFQLRLAAAFGVTLLLAIRLAAQLTPAPDSSQPASSPLPTLTTTHAVHSLSSSEAARKYPVHLRASITYYDPQVDQDRVGLFVHDATGSIFIVTPRGIFDSFSTGTLVDLQGVSGPGEFAPVVAVSQVHAVGFTGLPADAIRPGYFPLQSGKEDGQWVEVEGVIHSIHQGNHHIDMQLQTDEGVLPIILLREPGADYSRLVDARVRIRGNAGPVFNSSRTQMIGARLQVPNLSAVKTLEPAPEDPLKLPVIPMDRLLKWDVVPFLPHRVHVQGRVTLQWPGAKLCLRDATQGICAQVTEKTRVQPGERVDVAGFVSADGSAPSLTDAVFRRSESVAPLPAARAPIAPVPVTAEEIFQGGHESQLVQIDGQLISRDLASADTVLLLSTGKYIFKATLPHGMGGTETSEWKNGSTLRITGISSVQVDVQKSAMDAGTAVPISFQVLMRSSRDVTVVKAASWWTPAHLAPLLALALLGTLAVLAWVVLLRKRIRESEERFRHMAQHDSLTGLATRLVLEDRLNMAVESARRHQTGLGLLMLDVDRFKHINDTLGHHAGDEVLRVTARRMVETMRKSDTVARMGGDEFVVLLPNLNDLEMAASIAEKVVVALSLPVYYAGHAVPITVSVGVCTSASGELDADSLLKRVDKALYQAKQRGRNRFEVFSAEMVAQENSLTEAQCAAGYRSATSS